MKTYSSALTAYRAALKPHVQIDFISIRVKRRDDPESLVWCHYCSDEDNRTITITDPDTGLADARTFAGGGHLLAMGDLVRSEKQVIRSHSFTMSGASDLVLDMVHGYECREALFQWFIGEIDQDTGLLVDAPPCEFIGFVNTIDIADGALAIEGDEIADSTITITVDSLGAALTARNYDMRSLDVSEARGGDRFFEHGDSAHHWVIPWGKQRKRERDKKGGRGGNGGKAGGKGGGNAGGTGRARPDR